MRISLLLRREPFGEVLEKTLVGYWQSQTGAPVAVHWDDQPGLLTRLPAGQQAWWCNIYLNAIFVNNVEPAAFEPIRCEFSRSLSFWRRPFQKAYVSAATWPFLARYLAQARLVVDPPVENAQHHMIIPGNHKIRILDHHIGEAISILKAGFSDRFWQQELAVREKASSVGVPVPLLLSVGDGVIHEAYIHGTPLNRLPDRAAARRGWQAASEALYRLVTATCEAQSAQTYLSELLDEAWQCLAKVPLLTAARRQPIERFLTALRRHTAALSGGRTLFTCLCHGDFQPGNLLLDDQAHVWVIDWEYARRCQVGYDLLVYGLASRSPTGLAARLGAFLQQPATALRQLAWPETNWITPASRALAAWVFLLEELLLNLYENANPLFFCLGDGLLALQTELEDWLNTQEPHIA